MKPRKREPADAPGATQPSNGPCPADVPSRARSSNGSKSKDSTARAAEFARVSEELARNASLRLGRGRVTSPLDQRLRQNRTGGTAMAKIRPTRYVVRYVAIEEGAEVQLGDSGLPNIAGAHKLMGYQPAPIGPRTAASLYRPHGWLVVLVNEAVSTAQPQRLRRLKAVG